MIATAQLTNEQIARVFAMYLNAEVITSILDDDDRHCKGYVTGLSAENDYTLEVQLHNGIYAEEEPTIIEIENCKLLLAPLSSISDEDALFVDMLSVGEKMWMEDALKNGWVAERTKKTLQEYDRISYEAHEYLIQNEYAVPLFIAPHHPLNGKTAIEIGLAIDKTKLAP